MIIPTLEFLSSRNYKYYKNYDISKTGSMRVGGIAEYMVFPNSKLELVDLISHLCTSKVPYVIIGGLTNTLFATDYYKGVVICTKDINRTAYSCGTFSVECGAALSSFLAFAERCGYGGAEALRHIPGTLGGAIRGNAGAHGYEIADFCETVEVYFPEENKICVLSNRDLEFGYRDSLIKSTDAVVLSATIKLVRRALEHIRLLDLHYREIRNSAQPTGKRSLGCVFKRHNGVGAGLLIDKLGLKSARIGGAAVSDVHAGFIVNDREAVWKDVLLLVDFVENYVYKKNGIALEREIRVIT